MHDPNRLAESFIGSRPPLVPSPSPEDPTKTSIFGVSPSFLHSHAGLSCVELRSSKCGPTSWENCLRLTIVSRLTESGLAPSLTTLNDSVACFRGVKRPYDEEDDGRSILIYVLEPEASIVFEPDMASVGEDCQSSGQYGADRTVKPTKSLQISATNVDGINYPAWSLSLAGRRWRQPEPGPRGIQIGTKNYFGNANLMTQVLKRIDPLSRVDGTFQPPCISRLGLRRVR